MKPILIGLDNPHSDDPANALAPYPERSTGYRLWKMLGSLPTEVLAEAPDDVRLGSLYPSTYMDAFNRHNIFSNGKVRKTPRKLWRGCALELLDQIPKGATAVLLGDEVRQALNTVLTSPLKLMLVHPQVIDGVTWRVLPHPSGRVWFYNDPSMKMLAGLLLVDIAAEQEKKSNGKK